MPEIECIDLFGNKRSVPAERLELRVGAYGIILHQGAMLLTNTRSTGKFHLPGGGMEQSEGLERF